MHKINKSWKNMSIFTLMTVITTYNLSRFFPQLIILSNKCQKIVKNTNYNFSLPTSPNSFFIQPTLKHAETFSLLSWEKKKAAISHIWGAATRERIYELIDESTNLCSSKKKISLIFYLAESSTKCLAWQWNKLTWELLSWKKKFICLEMEVQNVSKPERQANSQGQLELQTGLTLL